MSLNTKIEIWIEVLKTRVPDITFNEAVAVSAQAASDWYNGANTELAKLFEQFVILKTLKGIKNDPETE